ncbi:hypothetical protein IKQ26_09770 [bacterium]|nr:hypothetical protein [bacterium]
MTRVTQKSFTGGELSPSLYSRNDLVKYSVGLRTLKNGFVRTEGCVSNRSGLELVCEVKDSSSQVRIIPFSFNTEQTYIIELGDKYARFIKDGGRIIYPDDYSDPLLRGLPVEITTAYLEDSLFSLKYAQNADVLTICSNDYCAKELSRLSHYNWTLSDITFSSQISAPENVSASWTGGSANPKTYTYLVTAVKNETYEESERSSEVSVTGEMESAWGTGEYITVTFNAVSDACEYNVYRSVNGIFAYVGTTATTTFVDDKIEPDLTATAPIAQNPFDNNNNPACVNYFQQRKVYACLKNSPQTLVASQTSTNNNFNISRPLNASDSINITLSEREVNEIRHIVALNDLILLTSGGEWKVNGSDGTFSASSNLSAFPQSFYGCSHIAPVVSGNMILFVQSGGNIVRDLGYTYVSDSYDGDELTIFANHLFEGKQIVDMAYAKEPYRILWCVMSDGTVNALTYNKKQEVCGWSRHETKGAFESVAVVRENNEDVPYFVVRRTINNQTKRFIERMASRMVSETEDGVFLDCSLQYSGSPVTTVSGLSHLEGEKVNILADGGLVEGVTVENGSVSIPLAASKITVGLPYEFEMETLNIEGENTHGLLKIANNISISVEKSRETFRLIGTDGDVEINLRTIESIQDTNYLYTGNINSYSFSNYTDEVRIHIKQPHPFPLTITSVSADVSVEN